MVINAINHT